MDCLLERDVVLVTPVVEMRSEPKSGSERLGVRVESDLRLLRNTVTNVLEHVEFCPGFDLSQPDTFFVSQLVGFMLVREAGWTIVGDYDPIRTLVLLEGFQNCHFSPQSYLNEVVVVPLNRIEHRKLSQKAFQNVSAEIPNKEVRTAGVNT